MSDNLAQDRMSGDSYRGTNDRYGELPKKKKKKKKNGRRTNQATLPAPPAVPAPPGAHEEGFSHKVHQASQYGKSFLIRLFDAIPFKKNSPLSTALIRHYVEGSGEPVSLADVPKDWQDLVVRQTHGRAGKYRGLSSYDQGVYDMQNALGHFDVDVTPMGNGENLYSISDYYVFGYKKNDRQSRHGFPLDLSERMQSIVKSMLPTQTYQNPGGFEEKWEIKKVKNETILFIPQQFLEQNGVPFEVRASFRR